MAVMSELAVPSARLMMISNRAMASSTDSPGRRRLAYGDGGGPALKVSELRREAPQQDG